MFTRLYLERPDGTGPTGLRHPDPNFTPSTRHVLAGHGEQESAITCLISKARDEAGLRIERQGVKLVQVVHHITPSMVYARTPAPRTMVSHHIRL